MEYRSILVHLDGSDRAQTCLDLALHVAQRHGARVNALYAPFVKAHDAGYRFSFDNEYRLNRDDGEEERRRALEHHFFSRLARTNLTGIWHTATKNAHHELLLRARFADLIVVGQSDPNNPDASPGNRAQSRLTLAAGRPVLWVPWSGVFPTVGERIVVAWDAGQSATRALHDALPFMRLAKKTMLVTLNAEHKDRIPGADIGTVLARHGVDLEVTALRPPPTVSVPDALLSRTAKAGSDLLVMGAYGHARWKELVLGGVTHSVLDAMPVPVLMSH